MNNEDNENNNISNQQELRDESELDEDTHPLFKRFFSFITDFIPAVSLIILTSISWQSQYTCNEKFVFVLRGFFLLGCVYLIKAFISWYLYLTSFNTFAFKLFKSTNYFYNILLTLIYYSYTIYSYVYWSTSFDQCVQMNSYTTWLLASIILIGIVDIIRNLVYVLGTIISFPVFINYFWSDPYDFISRYGIDPMVIDEWPTVKAQIKQCLECVICNETINEGDDIWVWKCDERHLFHEGCIKRWWKFKIVCPLCKRKNIL